MFDKPISQKTKGLKGLKKKLRGSNALCGYPLVKVAEKKICSFAPIFLSFNYFTQNIWGLLIVQFYFQDIFGAEMTTTAENNGRK